MRHTAVYHLSTHAMAKAVDHKEIEHYIRYDLARKVAELLLNYHKNDITVARHLDTYDVEYRLSLHVFTQKMLDEYVQYRIKEALDHAKRQNAT